MRRIWTLASLLFCLTAFALPAFAQAPTAVEAHTNGSGQIEVTWSAVANATTYNVYAGTTSGGSYTPQPNSPTTKTHLYINTAGDAVITYVVVTAVVGGTESGYSPQASCASGASQLPSPQNVTATATGGQVALTWSSVPGAASYDIYRTPTTPSCDSGLYLIHVAGTRFTDTGLNNGTTYTYQIAGVAATGTGNLSGPVRATPLAPPSLTATVEATAVSGSEILLAWTASAGATSYTLLRSTSSGAEVSYKTGIGGTNYKDANLSNNTTYYYQIKALADGGESAKSSEVSATTGSTPLAAPTLTAVARDAQVALSWTTVTGAAYYDLYRLPNADSSGLYLRVQGGATSTYTDKAVTDGTIYTYWVAAGASTGQGTPSNQVTATPVAQATLTGTPVSSTEVDLSWSASAGATGYHIDRNLVSDGGAWTPLVAVTGTSYADTGLTAGTDYYYRVIADNATGTAGPSNVVLAETFPPAVRLTALPGKASVILTWRAPQGNVGSYRLYRGTSPGGEGSSPDVSGLTTTRYTDTSVTNGTTYYYQLTTVNEGGESARSNEASATPVGSAPTVATAASASPNPVTGTTTVLSVLGASSGGESNLTYLWSCTGPSGVTYSDNGDNTAKTTTAIFTQLGSYIFTATITDASGNTATSSVSVTVIPTPASLTIGPYVPAVAAGSMFQFMAFVTDQFGNAIPQAAVTWSAAAGSITSGGLYTAPSFATTDTVSATAGAVTDSIPVRVSGVPAAPTGLTATPGNNQVTLAWTAPGGSGLTYNVYRGTSAGGEAAIPIITDLTSTSYLDTSVANGATYYYEVTAVDSAGESVPSNEASAHPPFAPPTVATAASASPNPVTGRTTMLTVLGASDGGEGGLSYTWTEAMADGTPLRANVRPNGTNTAKTVTAYFAQAGSYVFTVTISDGYGGTVTSMVTVTVYQAASSIVVSPDPASLPIDGSQPFTATVLDQFGTPITGATVAWSEDNTTCSIDPVSGVFTSGAYAGTATVTATDGSLTYAADATITEVAPTIATAASATPSPVTGKTTTLSVLGSDVSGESTLMYTWAVTSGPSGVTFSVNGTNAAKNTTATFTQSGTYTFTATITDVNGVTTTSPVTVVVTTTGSGPTVAVAASATPNPVTGTTTALSVLGASPGGESTLSYTWSATGPDYVAFAANGTNAAKNTTAGFSAAGTYTLTVVITDPHGGTKSSTVMVTVNQTASYIAVGPYQVSLGTNGTQQFSATELDQFGAIMAAQPTTYIWSTTASNGNISQIGFYTAPSVAETDSVQATDGSLSGSAQVSVYSGSAPITAPSSPTGLSATPGNSRVALTWSDGDSTVTSYNVYRSDSSGGEGQTPLATTTGISYTDIGTANDQTYFYTVTAVSSGGESVFSNEASAVPFDTPPTITVSAAASPNPMQGTTTTLSVTATTTCTPSSLTYTWGSSGPATVTFSTNGTSEASNTTATFAQAGTYTFTVVVTDAYGETTASSVTVTVIQSVTAISVMPSNPPTIPGGGTCLFQATATDQFGMQMNLRGVTWVVATGSGAISSNGLFSTSNVIGSETDSIKMTYGSFVKTVQVSVFLNSGRWGWSSPYLGPNTVSSVTGNVDDPTDGSITEQYPDGGGTAFPPLNPGQSGSGSFSGTVTWQYVWFPDAQNDPPPSVNYFCSFVFVDAEIVGSASGSFTLDDGLGDSQMETDYPDPPYDYRYGTSHGVQLSKVNGNSTTVSLSTRTLNGSVNVSEPSSIPPNSPPPNNGAEGGAVDFNTYCSWLIPPDVKISTPTNNSIIASGEDVRVTVQVSSLQFNSVVPFGLQSIALIVQGNALAPQIPDANGFATFDLGVLAAGAYTLTAEANYLSEDDYEAATIPNYPERQVPLVVNSPPSTFICGGSLTVQGGSWSPSPAYAGEPITGQATSAVSQSLATSPYYVTYSWGTQAVYSSQDGTSGTFEPYNGNYSIGWRQGAANTSFSAVFNDPGFYIVEVTCTANVIDNATGQSVATFTQTGYIGGSASDIDTSDGTANARSFHPNAQGGGKGISVQPPITIEDANGNILDTSTTPITVDAGQKIQLTAVLAPGLSLKNAQWNVFSSGTPIKDYIYTNSLGKVDLLSYTDRQSNSVTFYWINASSQTYAYYEGIDAKTGDIVSARVYYTVQKPSLSSLIAYYNPPGLVAYYIPKTSNPYVIGLGDIRKLGSNQDSGFICSAVPLVGNQSGTFAWNQVLHTYYDSSGVMTYSDIKPNTLDTSYGAFGDNASGADDSPNVKEAAPYATAFYFEATMYLMWQSNTSNSVPVPLGSISWGFDIDTDIGWVPTGLSFLDPIVISTSVNSEPTWSGVFSGSD